MTYIKKCAGWFTLFVILLGVHQLELSETSFQVFEEMLALPWLIEKGLRLYRDVVSMYPPGAFYILTGFYRMFNYSLASLRVFQSILAVVTDAALLYVCYTMFRSKIRTVIIFGFYMLWHPMLEGTLVWFDTITTPFLLMAYIKIWKYLHSDNKVDLLPGGLFLACALFIKQTTAWILVYSLLFLLFLPEKKFGERIRSISHLLLLPVLSVASFLTYMFSIGEFQNLLFWLLWVLFHVFGTSGHFILRPRRPDVIPLAGLAVVIVGAVLSGFVGNREKKDRTAMIFTLGWISAVLFLAYPRWALFHVAPSLPFISILLGYLWKKSARTAACAVIVIIFVLTLRESGVFWQKTNPVRREVDQKYTVDLSTTVNKEIGSSAFYSTENVRLVYFALRRMPVILPWIPITPMLDLLPELEGKLIDDIETKKIPYIVSMKLENHWFTDNTDISKRFRAYVLSHYRRRPVASDTMVEIYERL